MEQYSVKLKLYRGKKLYDQNGDIIADGTMDLFPYGSLEWDNFMVHAPKGGYWNAVVVEVSEVTRKIDKNKAGDDVTTITPTVINMDSKIVTEIKAAVKDAFDTTPKVALTPEQQEIEELKAKSKKQDEQIAELVANQNGGKTANKAEGEEKKGSSEGDIELIAWQTKYRNVIGKEPHPMSKASTLEKKIEEFLTKD